MRKIVINSVLLIPAISLFLIFSLNSVTAKPGQIAVKQEFVTVHNWHKEHENLKIAVFSDLHAGSPFITEEKLKEIVRLTNEQKPDLIIMLGDFLNEFTLGGKYIEPEKVASILGGLKAEHGVIAVLGNHDWGDAFCRLKEKHKFMSFITRHNRTKDGLLLLESLQKQGISVLENQKVKITINNKYFWLAGISDLKTGNPDMSVIAEIKEDNNPLLLLAHNPEILHFAPENVDLIMAGHTHGGQFRFPFFGNIYFSPRTRKIYKSGYFIKEGRPVFVTSGIGTSTLPIRWSQPEIVILNMR